MEVSILDKVGADDPLQALKDFGTQWANYFRGVQQVLDDNEQLRQQVAEQNEKIKKHVETENQLTEKNATLEMKLSEMTKLSGDVAKKSSLEGLLKAVRTFVKKSKHKRIEKRMAVKELLLELANANSIVFPEDLATTIDALDDEQSEAKVVNVTGNYNDVHDNGSVGLKE
jgi:hypothetical protein